MSTYRVEQRQHGDFNLTIKFSRKSKECRYCEMSKKKNGYRI